MLPLDFTWTAPESCPTQAEVVQQLSKAVDAGAKELPPLSARALVTQDGATWRLELTTEMDGRRGTRLLEADSCEGLSRAATLVLALTFGEGLARRQAAAEARAAQPKPQPAPPAKPPPSPAPLEPTRLQLWAAVAVGSDPLGDVGPAVVAGIALQPSLLRLGLRLEATFPRSSELEGAGAYVRSFSFSGGLQACLAPTLPPLQLSLCGDAGVTLLDAKGQGTALDRAASIPLYGLGPSAGVAWLFSDHAFLSLNVTSRFFLKRPQLVVTGLPQRRRVEAATLDAELGAGVRW